MKKVINQPADFVDETMEGIVAAYGDRVHFLDGDRRVLVSGYPSQKGKVGIVTAGGSGPLPLFLGYVGAGMVDACAVGNVFASPAYTKMASAIRAVDSGAGVLCLYGNYGGDKMNFQQAIEDCEFDDIRCRSVLACDDVASSPRETAEKRRGVAGILYAYKCAGAAAGQMRSLDEVAAVAEKAVANTRTMGVALTPCIVPEAGRPTFAIADDEIEIGMGIHGEKGITVEKMMTADRISEILMEKLLADLPLEAGDEVSVLVNGLGGTPAEELFIVYRRVAQILGERGVKIFMPHVGEFATSMEMAGLSVTLFKLDGELKELLRAPASTPFYTNANK
ncbi:dihydroxyacetone kinase subunit DhaK [uncultured Anaerotruncus sp.]|uniref:dihydroxyacetone kinase subunit DhaK n=1 Tax=uncultured Anaerotruncus sp. TaxID=905011 RepID=UPI00258F8F83|nr:dihydroxyacetone kinase subunit DhaK [uncultured Anaerotruncus sp.]